MGDLSNNHHGEVWTEEQLNEGNPRTLAPGFYWRLNPQKAVPIERKKYLRIERIHTDGTPPDTYYVPSVFADKYKKVWEKNPNVMTAPGIQDPGMDKFQVVKADGTAISLKITTRDLCKLMQTSLNKGVEIKPLDKIQESSNPLPTKSLYVRMKRKNIKWLDIGGGGVDLDRDEEDIYIPQPVIAEWSKEGQNSGEGGAQQGNPSTRHSRTRSGSNVQRMETRVQLRSDEELDMPSPSIWVRNGNGKGIEIHVNAHPSSQPSAWKLLYARAIKFSQAQGSAGRCLNPKLDLFLMPVSPDDKGLLKKAVEAARAKLGMDTSKAGNIQGNKGKEDENDENGDGRCKQNVMIWDEFPRDGKIAMYQKLARSPLGHYETWIKNTDYEAYLKARPDRPLPSTTDIEKVSVVEGSKAEKKAVTPGDGQVKKKTSQKGLNRKTNNNDTVKLRKRASEDGIEKKVDAAAEQIRPEIARLVSTEKLSDMDQRKRDIIATHVTSSKIRNACGTRENYPSQEQVMGASATAIANLFKWDAIHAEESKGTGSNSDNKNSIAWGSPRYALAEWLHRSAYSWGGLLSPGSADKDASGTSQIFRNLIFGTSECNSVMTRYEEAFKALIERRAEAGDSKDGGILVTDIKRDNYRAKFADNDEQSQPDHFRTNTRSWLCCAMDYTLYVGFNNSSSSRVGTFQGPYKETFYPFQRGFFTKFEKFLDQAILDQLYPRSLTHRTRPAPKPQPSSRREERKRPPSADLSMGPTPEKQIPPI